MSKQKQSNLLNGLLVASGIIIGSAAALLVKENQPLKASSVLKKVKAEFSRGGSIEGSWIDYDPIEFDRYQSKPLVYLGGITRLEENQRVYYQFAADIYTGDILNTFVLNSEKV